ncbi:MAG: fimbrillin family protein [Porphyromonas sp.]|nr:fimbrillin family protein [Porphyromonas sp.]
MNKRMLLVALAATVALGSCSKDKVVEAPKPGVINFNLSTANALRATPINSTNLTTGAPNFRVWGYLADGGTQYVGTANDGIHIAYQRTKWDYQNAADIAYWPSGAINFYAINPYDNANVSNYQFTSAAQKLDYSTPTANGDQIDLMYAVAKDITKDTNNYTANLKFRHALSQIVFKGQSVSNTLEVEIESITIHNVKSKGTYTLPTAATTGNGKGSWELKEDLGNFSAGLVSGANVPKTMAAVELSDKTTGALLLLPQVTTKWTTTSTGNVAIATADSEKKSYLKLSLKIKQNGVYIHGTADTFAASYVPFGETWEEGKKYIYTLKFGGGYDEQGRPILQPIQYSAEVFDWEEQNPSDVSLVTN